MFALRNTADADRLYSSRPQIAIGAISGLYLASPRWSAYYCQPYACNQFEPAEEEIARPYFSNPYSEGYTTITAYETFPSMKPWPEKTPVAAFWVFTSDKSPWPRASLKPLHRLSFAEACDWRDHIYTTEQTGIDTLTHHDASLSQPGKQPFQYDGIEGYILSACPPLYNCSIISPENPQKLYRRYSYVEQSYPLLLESQLALPAFSTYLTDYWSGGDGFLGYVFPNVDSDGDTIPDGMERMYGMNSTNPHSDCDSINDGLEFPMTEVQPSDLDPMTGGGCPPDLISKGH